MAHIFPTGIFDDAHLDQLLANVFASILKLCIDQLEIVNLCEDTPSVIVKLAYVPLYEKYVNWELSCKKLNNREKFQDDYSYLLTILNLVKSELSTNHSYVNLIKSVEIRRIEEDESRELLERNKQLRSDLEKLNGTIYEETASYSSRIHETIENIGLLKDELFVIIDGKLLENIVKFANFQETEDRIKIKIGYVRQLEISQQQQEEIKSNKTIGKCKITVEDLRQKIKGEIRNHEEVKNYLHEMMRDCNQTIREWMGKYSKETSELDGRIKGLRTNLEHLHNKHSQMRNIYTERQEEINDYLAYRERKRLEFEEEQRHNQAATKIQAWWRGTMYRRCLGPYRKRKSRKETAKKTKKN